MNNKFLITTAILAFGLIFNIESIDAQFQSLPGSSKKSISGEKIKKDPSRRGSREYARYIENNGKKKKIKTGRKAILHQSCSNFTIFFSEKKTKREKAIARERKKLS